MPRRPERPILARVGGALASVAVAGLLGPLPQALAAFASSTAPAAFVVSTVVPSPVTASACGTSLLGIGGEQITLSWTASTSPDLSAYAVIEGGTVVATLATTVRSWTDPTALTSGLRTYAIRADVGAEEVWHADSAPVTISFGLVSIC